MAAALAQGVLESCTHLRGWVAAAHAQGVSGDARFGELNLDMVPLEDDVLSLEMGHAFKVGLRSRARAVPVMPPCSCWLSVLGHAFKVGLRSRARAVPVMPPCSCWLSVLGHA